MASIDNLINDGEKISRDASRRFESSVASLEAKLIQEVNKIFATLDVSGGRISSSKKALEFLAGLENRIKTALKVSGYNQRVGDLLKNFSLIVDNNIKLQDIANRTLISSGSLTEVQAIETQNTIDKLLGNGINAEFVNPLREALYRNITFGGSIADAQLILQNFIVTKGNNKSILNKYVGQVARDSISQFDGVIQSVIGNELGLNDFLYSGSLIEDSRAQCVYWVGKRVLMRDELESEINTAINKGSLGGKTCSGMIPGTTVNSFSSYRGGYNCRHRAIAIDGARHTNFGNQQKEKRQAIQNVDIAKLEKQSKTFAPAVEKTSAQVAKKYKGTTTPINYKSTASIKRKANDDYNGDVYQVKDAVRNTIIVNKKDINKVMGDLSKDQYFKREKIQLHESDPLGYSGNIVNLQDANGVWGEVQVNTKWMIYAKEKEADARRILGDEVYNSIKKKKGIVGGRGHTLYEEYRTLKLSDPNYLARKKAIAKESKEYYSNFLDQ